MTTSSLTLRTRTHTGATTKGSRLTPEEADDDLIFLQDSANGTFIQSGSGAVSESVETALRKIKFSDSYSTLQAAADAAAGGILVVRGTNTITATVTLSSNTEVWFDPGALVQSATTSISLFQILSKTNVRIRGGHFKYTAAGSSGLIGGVEINTSTHCIVEDCKFEGMQFAGVYLVDSEYCTVQNNHIFSTLGTHSDAADIIVHNDSNYNKILGNRCLGSGAHGIFTQGQGTGGSATVPFRNVISKNVVNGKTTYGIVAYQSSADNSETVIEGNVVYDISGTGLAGASGSGIYVQTSGGCVVSNNIVRNCCTSTSSTNNGPGGISVASGPTGTTLLPAVVVGNQVEQPKYWGIFVSEMGATVTGNFVDVDDATNGRGIYVANTGNVAIVGNNVRIVDTAASQAILVFGSSLACKNITISGNIVRGGNEACIDVVQTSGSVTGVSITGNSVIGGGASSQGILLRSITSAVVSGNYAEAGLNAINVDACTNVRGTGNIGRGTTRNFLTGGANTNVFFDSSNDFDMGAQAKIVNSGTGAILEQRHTATPSAGTWAVGDKVWNSGPAAGEAEGWINTVAGAPGTFIPIGGLQVANSYTPTNVTTDRAYDADTVLVAELADVVGTLIADLQTSGVLK
jgi:parallel beta-helix repeat protein